MSLASHAISTDANLRQDAAAMHVAVSELVRLYQFRDRERICCHDISVTQCQALEVLVGQGVMRSQALAAELMLDKSTTTRVVDALVRKGYVERRTDADDARALALSVTTTGRALFERINDDLIRQQTELVADLEPQMRAAAIEVLRRLVRAAQRRFVSSSCQSACGPAGEGGCG